MESTPTPTLDDEISDLQAKISSLKSRLSLQTSTLLAAPSTRQLLTTNPSPSPALLEQSNVQQSHNLESLYRACASTTTFRARDPDPHAVDNGSILGLRIDIVSRTKFLRPYYVLLNRPFLPNSKHLRIHRHTVPPCIPLGGLAARHLPPPGGRTQDLARFAKVLRREVTRYHHRLGIVADLRKAAGVGQRKGEGEEEEEDGDEMVDVSAVDAEAKQVTFEWADGRTGRLVMGDDGEVAKLVVVGGEGGRDRETGRELLGGAVDAQEVVRRLAAGV
ncbi:Cenp-O kinetochore centromere component-domain-containing protein [Cladorrhinum sp. PSN332]|nr:Cenp-O kinetochore centromere component-domain-containing protein [Cladorrhinum sp. PSN332]